MDKLTIKTSEEVKKMEAGGKKLATVKNALGNKVKADVSAAEIEDLAVKLILSEGGKPSFKMVPGYSWATCVNVNEGLVHGIPKKELVFKDGDIVSVDVGMFFDGFHTDTSLSVLVGKDNHKQQFLDYGREALNLAIKRAKVGNTVKDISQAMQDSLEKHGLTPIKALVGHGIGKKLHEEPMIPCFVSNSRSESVKLREGMVIAIEVMYAEGSERVEVEPDGWTIRMKDGKLSALFEETVSLTKNGPKVLTR